MTQDPTAELLAVDPQYFELDYQMDTWSKPYRVVARITRNCDKIFYQYECVVTRLTSISAADLFKAYDQRDIVENNIKETKLGFYLDKTNSHDYLANTFRMLFSALAYNIVQVFKQSVLPTGKHDFQITTLRLRLFQIPAVLVKHARKFILKLSSNNIFDNFYWETLARRQAL
ncbi:transposase [Lactiplantibacillus pentosus]|uniref:transposase n=1 Tax=Lactiplantibacillus pentosus TaxID=1589 RepID=UPI0034E034F7